MKELRRVGRLLAPGRAEGARAPPYIGERFAQPEHGGWRKRPGRRGASVVLGQIELVGGDYRNRGRGEGGLLELPVEVGPADFPVAQGVFEMHGAFPGLRGLGEFAQIGDLSQVKVGQVVDQVCDMGGCGKRGTWTKAPIPENGDFVSAVTLLLISTIIVS